MCLRYCLIAIMLSGLAGCNAFNIQSTPTDLAGYVEIQQHANEAYQNEDWESAEKDYTYLAKNLPGETEPWFRLGNIYARTGRLDAAVATYREALVRDPKNSKIWHNLGIVQLRQATGTFIEMQEYTGPEDPLNQRAKYVVNTIGELLATGFDAADAP